MGQRMPPPRFQPQFPGQTSATLQVTTPQLQINPYWDNVARALQEQNLQDMAGFQGQKELQTQIKQRLAEIDKEDLPADLSPLMALSDTWFGGNLSKGYKPPETKREREALKTALQGQLADMSTGMTSQDRSLLQSKLQNAAMMAQLAQGQGLAQLKSGQDWTPGEKKVDTDFAKEYNDWVGGNGISGARKNIAAISGIAKKLEENPALTGTNEDQAIAAVGVFSEGAEDYLRKVLKPKQSQFRADAYSVAEQSMKQILGSQFTEKEGVRLLKRLFDPQFDGTVIAQNLRRLETALQQAALAKADMADYYQKNRKSLNQYEGSPAYKAALSDILTLSSDVGVNEQKPQPSGSMQQQQQVPMINVELQDGRRGQIPADQLDVFIQENPGAKEVK